MSKIIKAIIVDDQQEAIDSLKQDLILLFPNQIQIIGESTTIDEGKVLFKETQPDLIFLDIDLQKGTGFDFLNEIAQYDYENYHVIFTTAFNQFAIKAIKFSAFDYLLKPIDIDDLEQSLNRFFSLKDSNTVKFDGKENIKLINDNKEQKNKSNRIAIPTVEQIYYREVNEIVRCESEHNYTHIYLSSGEHFFVSKTIKEYEGILSDSGFFRVHQSHLVNLMFVSSFLKEDNGVLLLKNGTKIPVSRRNKDLVLKALGSL